MQHTEFSHRPPQDESNLGKTILIVVAGMMLVAGVLLSPKIIARVQLWRAEQALISSREETANIPEERFTPPRVPVNPPSNTSPEAEFRARLTALSLATLPAEKLLKVPFICQNPFQDQEHWDFHKESCEEAALLQSVLYLSGATVSATEANRIFHDMTEWQERPENFDAHIDLYGDDMEQFITGYYDLDENQVVHLKNLDREMIEKVIALGYPLIVPIQGNLLKNPFYPEPGYHMLTVIGYTADGVITNDVGTKRGEKYPYPWERFLSANEPVGNDALVVLSVEKEEQD